MTPFLKQVKKQGWKIYEIADILDVGKTRMAEISKAPTQWDWLALKGLGDKIVDDSFRGHPMENVGGVWRYCDTGETVAGSSRPCRKCGEVTINEGHEAYDACLGNLPNVMNACCGHGVEVDAYIQFNGDIVIRGREALATILALGDKREEEG